MKRHILPILLIVTLSFSLYANTLKNGFIYDDTKVVVNNPFIKDLGNLPGLLKYEKDYYLLSGEISYRPIVTFTYFIDYKLFGLKSWGFHLTSIIFHAVNSLLLYTFVNQFSTKPQHYKTLALHNNYALFVALLFTTQPILTEAINAICFREDVLCFTFYMLTLNFYVLRSNMTANNNTLLSTFFYVVSCISFVLALFSKEMAITFPLITYCYESIYKKHDYNKPIILNPAIIGYFSIDFVYIYYRSKYFYNPLYQVFNPLGEILTIGNISERLFTLPWLIFSYLKLTIFPISLSADYVPYSVRYMFSSSFLLPFAAISFISILTLVIIKRRGEIAFGLLFFLITLIPVYNVIPIDHPFAERYLYLPTAGFSLVAGYIVCHVYKTHKLAVSLALFIILAFYSTLALIRNNVWENEYTLWSDTIKRQPSSVAYNNLGIIYYNRGALDEAAKQFTAAIKFDLQNAFAHNNLGLTFLDKSRLDDAVSEFKSAIRWKPDYAEAYNNLGTIYFSQKQYKDAIQSFKFATQMKTGYLKAHMNLGVAYYETGILDEAAFQFKTVLDMNPENEIARNYLNRVQQARTNGFR